MWNRHALRSVTCANTDRKGCLPPCISLGDMPFAPSLNLNRWPPADRHRVQHLHHWYGAEIIKRAEAEHRGFFILIQQAGHCMKKVSDVFTDNAHHVPIAYMVYACTGTIYMQIWMNILHWVKPYLPHTHPIPQGG